MKRSLSLFNERRRRRNKKTNHRVANMQTGAGRVREHVQDELLVVTLPFHGLKDLILFPESLPLGFHRLKVVESGERLTSSQSPSLKSRLSNRRMQGKHGSKRLYQQHKQKVN